MWKRARSVKPPEPGIGDGDTPLDEVELRSLRSDAAQVRRVTVVDDAASSVNIDEEAVNEDGSELINTARSIINNATMWRSNQNDFDAYTVEAARRVLENAPKQRHLFHAESDARPAVIEPSGAQPHGAPTRGVDPDAPATPNEIRPIDVSIQPVRSTLRDHPGFSDGFFDEAPSEASSIFTMNIDMDELPSSQTMRLARSFRPNDFKWLCLTGGLPLGLFVGTSNCIGVSGPLGTLLGFLLVIPGVLSVMSSLSEMIAFFPMEGGFPLLVSAYVDRALGFAVGVCYWISCAILIPSEILKCLRLLSLYAALQSTSDTRVVFLTFLLGVLFLFSCLTTRMASLSLRLACLVTAGCLSVMLVFMWIYDAGGISNVPALGAYYWNRPFRWHHFTRHNGAVEHLFQTWHGVAVALESYSGVEIPFTAMPEIRNPRRTVKKSMRLLTVRIVVIYLLVVFSFTLVTSAATLRDFHINSNDTLCNVHQRVVMKMFVEGILCTFFLSLGKYGLCSVAFIMNAFFVFQGIFSAGMKLFGATRTLHGLGISGLVWRQFAWCSRDSVPIVAAVVSLSLLPFGYLIVGVSENDLFAMLTTCAIQMYLLVWAALCIAYMRFHKAIRLQQPRTRISRNDEDYPYKSMLQPWTAMFGLFWCVFMFCIMTVEHQIATTDWKARFYVAGFLPLGIFIGAYLGYKVYHRTRLVRYDDIGLVSAKQQMDSEEWAEDRVYSDGFREKLARRWNRLVA